MPTRHLIGHRSRNYPGMLMSACSIYAGYPPSEKFTTTIDEVTCKWCKKLIESKKELDPITRNFESDHPSCVHLEEQLDVRTSLA